MDVFCLKVTRKKKYGCFLNGRTWRCPKWLNLHFPDLFTEPKIDLILPEMNRRTIVSVNIF